MLGSRTKIDEDKLLNTNPNKVIISEVNTGFIAVFVKRGKIIPQYENCNHVSFIILKP